MTHYIPAFTEINGRDQLAACNVWVREDQHSTEPTCPTCKQYLVEDSRELTAEDVFGAFDPSTVVKPTFHENQLKQEKNYRLRTS